MKIDREALKSAMSTVVTELGLAPAREAKVANGETHIARIATYQQTLTDGGFTRTGGKKAGKFRKLSAGKQLEVAIKCVKLGGTLPEEYVSKADWYKAPAALEVLADAAGIDRAKMLSAFGCTPVAPVAKSMEQIAAEQAQAVLDADAAAKAAPVVEAAPVVVVSAPSKGNVVGIRSDKKGNKKTA